MLQFYTFLSLHLIHESLIIAYYRYAYCFVTILMFHNLRKCKIMIVIILSVHYE